MRLLFATDGFDAAEQAARFVARVADPDRVEVTVISVIPKGLLDLEHAVRMLDRPEDRRTDTLGLVDYWVDSFRSDGFTAGGRMGEGRPGEEIVRAIEESWYDLTVVGSGHHSWLGQRLLGSVSSHVLHSSPTSVLVVHDAPLDLAEVRVLMAADGSRSCEFAARALRDLVSPSKAAVKVVTCFSAVAAFAAPGTVAVMKMPSGEEYVHAMEAAERVAGHFSKEFRDAGFAADPCAAWGQPVEQILKETSSFPADLVVVGSRGHGPVKRTLLGSVSDQVVRHAPATLVGRRLTK